MQFVLLILACQVGLLFLGGTPLRLPLRMAVYGASLLLLVLSLPPRGRLHPSYRWALGVFVVLLLSFAHPERNTVLAALGQIGLYVAILSPIIWVASPRARAGRLEVLQIVILLMWGFNTASAAVGVLQVYYPGQFEGAVSELVAANKNYQLGSAAVSLADGTLTQRPMGLTDTPGSAAHGGVNAIVLGMGVWLAFRNRWLRWAALGGVAVGLFSIILSQVRVSFVMALCCVAALLFVLFLRGRLVKFGWLAILIGCVGIAAATWAFSVGGEQTTERFTSLIEDDLGTVYKQNRGKFILNAIENDLPQYPLGAGLGNWGMMNAYFGTRDGAIWSELIWTSWLYDGGIPLIVTYAGAFGTATWVSWRLTRRSGPLGYFAAAVFAYNLAAWAGTLVFPIFSVQVGLEVWLLNACLWAASQGTPGPTHQGSLTRRTPHRSPQQRPQISVRRRPEKQLVHRRTGPQ